MLSRFIEKSYVQYLYYVLFNQKGAQINSENAVQLLLTLNEHNCFITLNMFEHFSYERIVIFSSLRGL